MKQEMLTVAYDGRIDPKEFFSVLPQRVKAHSRVVAQLTEAMIREALDLGVCDRDMLPLGPEQIRMAVLFHDIGMVLVPDRILEKKEELTGAERRVMQRHSSYGGKMLEKYRKDREYPPEQEAFWQQAAEVAVSHHERWDGKGYPFGLLATAIPLVSRMVALADCYDSIVRGAPYRMPLPHEYALLEIADNSGSQFDPDFVEVFKQRESIFNNIMIEDALAYPSEKN